MLAELERARHNLLGTVEPTTLDLKRCIFAVVPAEPRLGIEHVDGARAAAHVDEDH